MTHLHRQLRFSRPARRRLMSAGGYALPVVLVAGFVASLGAVTLSSRALSMRVGDELQAQALEARGAADSGLEAVIGEFNKPRNMALAASRVPMHTWSGTNPELRNQCFSRGSQAPTSEALSIAGGSWQTIQEDPNSPRADAPRFRIRSAEIKNAKRDRRLLSNIDARTSSETKDYENRSYNPQHVLEPPKPGESPQPYSRLSLTIEGQSLRNGAVVATSVVTSELNVLPKNCGQSVVGDDDCPPDQFCNGSFPRLLIGLDGGGVLGAATGSLLREQVSGSTTTNNNKKLESVLCLNESGTCGGNIKNAIDGVPIQTLRLKLPELPQFPRIDTRTGASTGSNGIVLDVKDNRNSLQESYCSRFWSWGSCRETSTRTSYEGTRDFLRVNSAGRVELCNVANNNTTKGQAEPNMPVQFVAGSCSTAIDQFCARTGDKPENYAYHCRIARLHVSDKTENNGEANRIQNNTFFVDTSRAPVYLHFNTPWASPAACGSSGTLTEVCTEANWDDGQIQHLYCPTASDATPCNRRALPDQSPRAILYSNKAINVRIGDDGYIRDLFMYLPKGTVTLAEDPDDTNNAFGTPNFRGSMWINNLQMSSRTNYTTAISVPPFSDSFFGFGSPKPSDDNPFMAFIPLFEWTITGNNTRSVYTASTP